MLVKSAVLTFSGSEEYVSKLDKEDFLQLLISKALKPLDDVHIFTPSDPVAASEGFRHVFVQVYSSGTVSMFTVLELIDFVYQEAVVKGNDILKLTLDMDILSEDYASSTYGFKARAYSFDSVQSVAEGMIKASEVNFLLLSEYSPEGYYSVHMHHTYKNEIGAGTIAKALANYGKD